MQNTNKKTKIGILGAGVMGSGIAQVAATGGHQVVVYDNNITVLEKARGELNKILARQVEKRRMDERDAETVKGHINFVNKIDSMAGSGLVIEAITESLEAKQKAFVEVENIVSGQCILATNTSSLSIISIASACKRRERVIGVHFFNPAPLMPLVEIIPSITTDTRIVNNTKELVEGWDKVAVIAKDTPGFIVNRIARPYYGEALRLCEENFANIATIDWAMKEFGGFKMGPFELMDYIGNDINYTVTETIFRQLYFDSRYKPSITQKRLVEANFFGKKSGKGFYDYEHPENNPEPLMDKGIGEIIFNRILSMLVNAAVDAVFLHIATIEDIELAMTKGTNYPKGLLQWADDLGLENVLSNLENLYSYYGEERYRPSPLLRKMVKERTKFFEATSGV